MSKLINDRSASWTEAFAYSLPYFGKFIVLKPLSEAEETQNGHESEG